MKKSIRPVSTRSREMTDRHSPLTFTSACHPCFIEVFGIGKKGPDRWEWYSWMVLCRSISSIIEISVPAVREFFQKVTCLGKH